MNVLRSLENEDEHKRMQMIRYLTTQKQALSINILVFNTPPPQHLTNHRKDQSSDLKLGHRGLTVCVIT